MLSRIRRKLARTVLTGGLVGSLATGLLLAASTDLPWDRFLAGDGPAPSLFGIPGPLSRDGWGFLAAAIASLAIGGLVQLSIHEWRLRAVAVVPANRSAAAESAGVSAALLRGLPPVSALASMVSWSVGGTLLAVLSRLAFELDVLTSVEIGLVCAGVGAGLAPFRYLRVRTDLVPLWEELNARRGDLASESEHAVFPLRLKLALAFALPVWAVVTAMAGATAQHREALQRAELRGALGHRATELTTLVDRAVGKMELAPVDVRGTTLELLRDAARDEVDPRLAILDGSGQVLLGRLDPFEGVQVARALEQGELELERPDAYLGAAKLDAANLWLAMIARPAAGAGLRALTAPGVLCVLAIAAMATVALAWGIARDQLRSVRSAQSHLETWNAVGSPPRVPSAAVFGDDEIAELGAALASLAAATRQRMKSLEARWRAVEEAQRRLLETARDALTSADRSEDATAPARRSVERLVEAGVGVGELVEQIERETESRQEAIAENVRSLEQVSTSCERVAEDLDQVLARFSQVLAVARPLIQDARAARPLAESGLTALGATDDSQRNFEGEVRLAADSAREATDSARSGEHVLFESLERIGRVRVALGDVGRSVHRVEEKVGVLGHVLHVMDEVGDRTTLLSVNAAILAAQADERMAGFTVVADEIRDLAQRTGDCARDIAGAVEALRGESRAALDAVELASHTVDEGALGVQDARRALLRTATAARGTRDRILRMAEIADAIGADVHRGRESLEQLLGVGHRIDLARASLGGDGDEALDLEARYREVVAGLRGRVRGELLRASDVGRGSGRARELLGRLGIAAGRFGSEATEVAKAVQSLNEAERHATLLARAVHELATRLGREVRSAYGSSRP